MASFAVCTYINTCIFLIYKNFHPQNIASYKWKMSQQHEGFAFKSLKSKKFSSYSLEQILSSLTQETFTQSKLGILHRSTLTILAYY